MQLKQTTKKRDISVEQSTPMGVPKSESRKSLGREEAINSLRVFTPGHSIYDPHYCILFCCELV